MIPTCLSTLIFQKPNTKKKMKIKKSEYFPKFTIRIIRPSDKIVLLSDFDGTIATINSNSNLTTIRPEATVALAHLVSKPNFFVGFISGRGMFDLKRKIGVDGVTYSGNHGMEILFPNSTKFFYPIAPELSENRTKIKESVENEVRLTKNLFNDNFRLIKNKLNKYSSM